MRVDSENTSETLREKLFRSENESEQTSIHELDELSAEELQSFIRQNWGKKVVAKINHGEKEKVFVSDQQTTKKNKGEESF